MMKRPLIFLTLLLSITAHAQTRDWENPAVLGINKLPYHATLQLPSKQKECINMQYPFHRDRPSVTGEPNKDWYAYDHRNPVGSYVTFFDVTKEMLSKNLILHFGSVHSAMYVWINGQEVGYSQNSMSPLTPSPCRSATPTAVGPTFTTMVISRPHVSLQKPRKSPTASVALS